MFDVVGVSLTNAAKSGSTQWLVDILQYHTSRIVTNFLKASRIPVADMSQTVCSSNALQRLRDVSAFGSVGHGRAAQRASASITLATELNPA